MTLPNRLSASTGVGLLAAPILVLLVLLVFLPPDGTERSAWAQFIGRFHPLVVHLPIALILLVPVMELVGRDQRFPYLRASAPFVLVLALIGGIVASLLGWCLGRSGGFSGPLVTQHMWSGASLITLCGLCGILRGGKDGGVVKAGDLRGSDLFRRITLSSTDDNFMPKGGKPPLSPDQVKLIELWIADGASGTASLDSIKGAPAGVESSVRAE